ncbi:MAG: enzyme of heme biosynthesis, partial [Alistipes sp.]|nr:enzyme of heme biosynthesis [Alistipes sp.]
AIYWVAYDLIQKALPLLEVSDPERVEAAKQLAAAYRAAFPTSEECFFNEVADGSSFTVNCGFAQGVSTTVRSRAK